MPGKFLLSKSGTSFRFTLLAGNDEKILSSESYTAKAGATNGIESVKKNATDDARYARLNSKSNQPYVVLKAANNELIGTSQMYGSPEARDKGIEAVKAAAPLAPVVEQP